MFLVDPLKAAEQLTASVKTLGAITVAFFILLVAFLAFTWNISSVISENGTKIDSLDLKVTNAIEADIADDRVVQYFMRQICYNTADTEGERNGCNPPPRLIEAANQLP